MTRGSGGVGDSPPPSLIPTVLLLDSYSPLAFLISACTRLQLPHVASSSVQIHFIQGVVCASGTCLAFCGGGCCGAGCLMLSASFLLAALLWPDKLHGLHQLSLLQQQRSNVPKLLLPQGYEQMQ